MRYKLCYVFVFTMAMLLHGWHQFPLPFFLVQLSRSAKVPEANTTGALTGAPAGPVGAKALPKHTAVEDVKVPEASTTGDPTEGLTELEGAVVQSKHVMNNYTMADRVAHHDDKRTPTANNNEAWGSFLEKNSTRSFDTNCQCPHISSQHRCSSCSPWRYQKSKALDNLRGEKLLFLGDSISGQLSQAMQCYANNGEENDQHLSVKFRSMHIFPSDEDEFESRMNEEIGDDGKGGRYVAVVFGIGTWYNWATRSFDTNCQCPHISSQHRCSSCSPWRYQKSKALDNLRGEKLLFLGDSISGQLSQAMQCYANNGEENDQHLSVKFRSMHIFPSDEDEFESRMNEEIGDDGKGGRYVAVVFGIGT